MVGGGDVEAETRQVLSNLKAVLTAAGCSPQQVVRTTVFLVDLGDFAKVNAIYAETFGHGVEPARACVQVAALPKGQGGDRLHCRAGLVLLQGRTDPFRPVALLQERLLPAQRNLQQIAAAADSLAQEQDGGQHWR